MVLKVSEEEVLLEEISLQEILEDVEDSALRTFSSLFLHRGTTDKNTVLIHL